MALDDSGFLGNSWDDPKTHAILGLAAGLLQGGASSGNFGAALGQGLQGGLLGMKLGSEMSKNAITTAQQKALLGIANQLSGNGQTAQAAQQALSTGAQTGDVGPTVTNAARMTSAAPTATGTQSAGFPLSLQQVTALKLLGKDVLPEFKYANDGVERKPGTFYRNPVNGQMEYIPDVKTGFGYNPATNSVSVLPGFLQANNAIEGGKAEANKAAEAKYAGPIASAQEGAKAAMDMVTVNMPQGPVMMTRAQAAQMSGGSAQNSPAIPYAIQARVNYANSIKDPQLRQSFINTVYNTFDGLPNKEQLSAAWTSALGGAQSGQMANNGMPGIALQSDAQKAAAINAANKNVDLSYGAPKSFAGMQESIDAANALLAHPGLKTATGLAGTIDPRNYIPGTDAADFKARLDQLKGKTFLSAYDTLKGGGQITEVEGKKATDAIGRLNTAQSTAEFVRALNDYKNAIQAGENRLRGQLNGAPPTNTGYQQQATPRPAAQQTGVVYSKSGKPMVQVNGQWHYVTGASGNW